MDKILHLYFLLEAVGNKCPNGKTLNFKKDRAKRKYTQNGSQKMDTKYQEFLLSLNLKAGGMLLF